VGGGEGEGECSGEVGGTGLTCWWEGGDLKV
jgi:hypothetical protein